MNRRKFLSALAAVPVVGPVAAMAAQAVAPASQIVVEKMSTDSVRFTPPACERHDYHWYMLGKDGLMEFVNGEWAPAADWRMPPG